MASNLAKQIVDRLMERQLEDIRRPDLCVERLKRLRADFETIVDELLDASVQVDPRKF